MYRDVYKLKTWHVLFKSSTAMLDILNFQKINLDMETKFQLKISWHIYGSLDFSLVFHPFFLNFKFKWCKVNLHNMVVQKNSPIWLVFVPENFPLSDEKNQMPVHLWRSREFSDIRLDWLVLGRSTCIFDCLMDIIWQSTNGCD